MRAKEIFHKVILFFLWSKPSSTTFFLYSLEFKYESFKFWVLSTPPPPPLLPLPFALVRKRGQKYNHADVQRIAHNRPQTNIIIKVIMIIDIPNSILCSRRSFELIGGAWIPLFPTRWLPSRTGNETLWDNTVCVFLGLGLSSVTTEPGRLLDLVGSDGDPCAALVWNSEILIQKL